MHLLHGKKLVNSGLHSISKFQDPRYRMMGCYELWVGKISHSFQDSAATRVVH